MRTDTTNDSEMDRKEIGSGLIQIKIGPVASFCEHEKEHSISEKRQEIISANWGTISYSKVPSLLPWYYRDKKI